MLSLSAVRTLALALPSFVLPTIEDLSELSELGRIASGDEPILAITANLKRVYIEATRGERKVDVPELYPSDFRGLGDRGLRSMADYYVSPQVKKRIMVEWREIGIDEQGTGRSVVENRIRQLAHLLRTPKSFDFRTLTCLGLVHFPQDDRYGFVFDLPSTVVDPDALPVTLFELLNLRNNPPPALGARIILAQKIASALCLLHASGWLHRGLRPHNILFFDKSFNPNDPTSITSPYIAGFGYALPDDAEEVPRPFMRISNPEYDMYRHPSVRDRFHETRYEQKHDIYSLGVILYEIGVWGSVTRQFDKYNTAISDFDDQLLKECE